MIDFLKNCIEEVFTKENLNTLWLNRQSKQDIIGLEKMFLNLFIMN